MDGETRDLERRAVSDHDRDALEALDAALARSGQEARRYSIWPNLRLARREGPGGQSRVIREAILDVRRENAIYFHDLAGCEAGTLWELGASFQLELQFSGVADDGSCGGLLHYGWDGGGLCRGAVHRLATVADLVSGSGGDDGLAAWDPGAMVDLGGRVVGLVEALRLERFDLVDEARRAGRTWAEAEWELELRDASGQVPRSDWDTERLAAGAPPVLPCLRMEVEIAAAARWRHLRSDWSAARRLP